MRRIIPAAGVLGALAVIASSSLARATTKGHLQIPVEAGVVAEVDGRLSARGRDDRGVIIRDLEAGPHRLVLRREGAEPQRALVYVRPGQVTVHTPAPWATRGRAARDGMLILQTLPVEATIKAKSLGWRKVRKGSGPLRVRVPAGRHRLKICNEDRCIDYTVVVPANRLRSILVDMDRGRVDDLSVIHARQWEQDREACQRAGSPTACARACTLDAALRLDLTSPACGRMWPRTTVAGAAPPKSYPASDRR